MANQVSGPISQDFENAYKSVEQIRLCQEANTQLIKSARATVEALNSWGETKTAIVNLFLQWEQNMEAENVKLGQFADAANKVIIDQENKEGIRRDETARQSVESSAAIPRVPTS